MQGFWKHVPAGGILAALVFSLSLIAASSASAQTVDEIISRGKLVVAIDTTTPPYGFLGADLKPTGFDIEVANKMGEALGVPVEFVTVTSPGRIPALLTKQVDAVISIFSITPARAIQIDYSIPYAGQSAVVIAPKSTSIKGHADLVGKKVGLTRGTGEDGLLTAAAEANPGIEILRFDDYSSLLQAMVSGQIDAMGGGDYGEIYLKKTAERRRLRAEVHSEDLLLRHRRRQGQRQSPAVDQHLAVHAEDRWYARGAVDEVSQPAASGASGILIT